MKTREREFWKLAIGSCLVAVSLSASAATIIVTSKADSGAGSLRAALAAAGNGDTIDATGLSGSIKLTNGELLVSKSLTILGPGPHALAVDGNARARIFHISNSVTAAIFGFTVTNGAVLGAYPTNLGGGIWNEKSTLTLSNCVITHNQATNDAGGGIYNDSTSGPATLSISASTISYNVTFGLGGGIYNNGQPGPATLSINASTLNNNSVIGAGGAGGAIFNQGNSGIATLSVTNSTFYNNDSTADGGAIYNAGVGTAELKLIACTFYGNTASGAGANVYNNGGGARLEIGNTILKSGALEENLANNGVLVISDGYNLCSDVGQGQFTNPTDQTNTEPMLNPLADNGGPTFTVAMMPGSPAIDKGKSFGLTTDQRGVARPVDFPSLTNASGGDGSDIGAFEAGRPVLGILPAGSNVVLVWPASGPAFQPRSGTNLSATTNWTAVSGTSNAVGGLFYFTNRASARQTFYRLSLP
jgi:hypothetical protein